MISNASLRMSGH